MELKAGGGKQETFTGAGLENPFNGIERQPRQAHPTPPPPPLESIQWN